MSRSRISTCTIRATAIIFAVALTTSTLAVAQELRTTNSEFTADVYAEVSVSELAASEANRVALEEQLYKPAIEQPAHRLPNGELTSEPSQELLDRLPWSGEPNALTRSANTTPSFASIKGFSGLDETESVPLNGYYNEPPDQGLAVNNNVAVEIVNNILQFFNATTGASLKGPIATSVFFSAATGTNLTDTQVFYDPTTKHWFLTEIISNNTTTEDIAIAVSKTSSATGSYYIYHIRAFSNDVSGCGSEDCFPDYPKAGYDKNIFIVDVDLYNSAPMGKFVAAAAYAVPKSKLETGASFTYERLIFPGDFVVQPSVPAPGEPFAGGANGTEYLMEARHIVDGSNNVRVWAISNTNNIVTSPSSLRGHAIDVKAESYGATVPSTQPDVVGPYCKSKGVTSAPQLDGGYGAFQSTVQKANGKLYGALAYGSKDTTGFNRDVIAWFALSPSVNSSGIPSAAIFKQGYLVPTNGYSLTYPAFGLNKSGAGAIGFTETNKSKSVVGGYPSASIIQFTGTGTTGIILVTGKGQTSDDGFTGCPGPGPGKVGRWGDYGAATVDAVTGYFYTGNEMIPHTTVPAGQAANWGTFITQMH